MHVALLYDSPLMLVCLLLHHDFEDGNDKMCVQEDHASETASIPDTTGISACINMGEMTELNSAYLG